MSRFLCLKGVELRRTPPFECDKTDEGDEEEGDGGGFGDGGEEKGVGIARRLCHSRRFAPESLMPLAFCSIHPEDEAIRVFKSVIVEPL